MQKQIELRKYSGSPLFVRDIAALGVSLILFGVHMRTNGKDETGKRYGRLTVIEEMPAKHAMIRWLCKCDCGKQSVVYGTNLRSGQTKSCGCFKVDANKKHGMLGTVEYKTWTSMIDRCENPNCSDYKNYGARGINICQRWRESFQNFFDDMGYRPNGRYSIDRINTNGNYEPANCQWATDLEQQNNRRNNLPISGAPSIAQYCREHEICRFSFRHHHVLMGRSIDEATRRSKKGVSK